MHLFDGPGETRALCRAFDWSRTPLGPVEGWPDELTSAVRLMMPMGIPAMIVWGPGLTQIYNDAFARLIGGKHPEALGNGNRETWPNAWSRNEPIYRTLLAGETVVLKDAVYEVRRGDQTEHVAVTVNFSPIVRADGGIDGFWVHMLETTDLVGLRELQRERSVLLERLQAEQERLATVFRDAPSFLAVLRGPEHRFEMVNEVYRTLVGDRDVVGRTVAEALPEAAEQGFIAILDRVRETREPFIGREIPIQLKRSAAGPVEVRYLDFVYMPYIEGDTVTGIVCHGNDVTEEVVARREVERLWSESVRAKREAEEERARLDDVLEGMSDAHCTMNAEFRFTRVNRAFEDGIGIPKERLLGRTHWECFPASVGTVLEERYRFVQRARVEQHFVHHYVGEGLDLWVEVDAYPARDGGLSVFWRDVTSRIANEGALERSEQRFRAVQDSSPNGSIMMRPILEGDTVVDFEYVYLNPAAARITGLDTVTMVGKRLLEVFPNSPRDGYYNHLKHVAETGALYDEEITYTRDNRTIGLHLTIVRAGEMVHVRFADVTQRMREEKEREQLFEALEAAYAEAQAAELRLRNLFEQAPVSIAVMEGPDLVYTIVSPRYAESPARGRNILGKPVLEAFPELDPNGFPAKMRQVYETGVPFRASAVRVMLDDAQDGNLVEHWFDVGYQPLRNASGNVYAIASVAYDVTEQIRARRDVEQARETAERALAEAEAASRAKSEFLAVMSHELRTPLNAIGGYTELIELGIHGPITDAQRNALARIQASQRHLLGLINGVLNYSRVEAGAVTYNIERIPVAEAIAEAETLVAPQLRTKGLGYTWMGCAPHLALFADREKLQQILLNLLSNAIKFTEAREGQPGRVMVSCDIEEPAGDRRDSQAHHVRIHVKDTGVGIEADKLRSIFEPFVQVDQRLTRRQEGVGLGLTISRDLARGMNGDLTAESAVGVGSVFTLSLPMA